MDSGPGCALLADDACFTVGVGRAGADSPPRKTSAVHHMLPAPYRLRGKRNLRRVQTSPKHVRTGQFTLRVVRRDDARPPRVSIAVGRRVSKRAVERNQVTRWLREAIRMLLPRLRPGVDLRLSATAPAAQYSFRQCVSEVETLFKNAGLLRG